MWLCLLSLNYKLQLLRHKFIYNEYFSMGKTYLIMIKHQGLFYKRKKLNRYTMNTKYLSNHTTKQLKENMIIILREPRKRRVH